MATHCIRWPFLFAQATPSRQTKELEQVSPDSAFCSSEMSIGNTGIL